jgi:hypothetical protein
MCTVILDLYDGAVLLRAAHGDVSFHRHGEGHVRRGTECHRRHRVQDIHVHLR